MRLVGACLALAVGLGGCGPEYWTYEKGNMHLTGHTIRGESFPERPASWRIAFPDKKKAVGKHPERPYVVVAGGTVRWGTGSTLWSLVGLEREATEPLARRALERQARQYGGDAVVLLGSSCEDTSYTHCAYENLDFLIIRYVEGPEAGSGS